MAVNAYSDRFPVLRLAIAQVLVTLFTVLILTWIRDWHVVSAGSALLGCLLVFVVCDWFLWRTASRQPASDALKAEASLLSAYSAEFGKMLFAGVLLGLAFKYGEGLDKLALIAAFCLTWLVNSIVTAMIVIPATNTN